MMAKTEPGTASSVGRRVAAGFAWGLAATAAMSIVLLLARLSGASPTPEPLPIAIVHAIFGTTIAPALVIVFAVLAHFGYGALWAGLFAAVSRPVTFARGIAFGVFLWFVMSAVVLPLVGWGAFGGKIHPLLWFAMLVVHLVYGGTLGLLLDRHEHVPVRSRPGAPHPGR